MENVGIIVGVVAGLLSIIAMLYAFLKWLGAKAHKENQPTLDSDFDYANERMPELLAEMRYDLTKHPLCREFIILSKKWCYNSDPNKQILCYYFEDHDALAEKVGILENLGLVEDITFNNTQRYCMSEHFVNSFA